MQDANRQLSSVEQIKRYEALCDEWLPGGDELTSPDAVPGRERDVAEDPLAGTPPAWSEWPRAP